VRAENPEGADGDIAIEWGSDAMAELLSRLGLRYLALVPGSSYYPADYDFALEGSHVERWKALQAGTIDAALQMVPYDDMAVQAGFTSLGPVTEEFALNAVCVRLPAERAVLTPFLQALAEAAQWFRGHVEESAAIAAMRTSIEPRYALRACQLLAAGGIIPRDLRSAPGALAAVTGALRSSRLFPPEAPDPIAAAVDYSYLR